jgi:hypothetical protein
VKLRDRRYLFGLTPWAFFPLWLALGVGLSWSLDDAPLWLRIVVIGPISWTMPFYMARMPFVARIARRRGSGGTSRWGDGRPDERWN